MTKQALTLLGAALFCLSSAVAADQPGHTPATSPHMVLTFGGIPYVHRWSKSGQHEFTPPSEQGLSKWHNMITINVYEWVKDGHGLANAASRVHAAYKRNGKILRVDSKPRTRSSPAEHFLAALLAARGVREVAFAHFILRDGVGYAVVYSRRAYGPDAANEIGPWIAENGAKIESQIKAWNGVPTLTDIKRLPKGP